MKEKYIYTFYLCLLILLSVLVTMKVVTYITSQYSYYSFEVSDWLINYEGGFVRRGLVGEVLYELYSIIPFSVKSAIKIINCIIFFCATIIIVRVCAYLRTGILPFLTIFCGAISTLGWYRRDFLVLLVAYFVIMLHIRQLKKCNGRAVFVLSQILMILLMLIHEASFFFVFPILLLITWFISSGTVLNKEKIQICAKYFIIPLISMVAITLMKGNEEIANSIWRSWSNLFVRYPEENIPDIGAGVRWLTNGIKDTTEFHLDLNFQMHLGILAITKNIIMLLITLFTTYFLMLRNLYVDFCNKRINYSENNTAIANTLLIQLFFMTPMFTFLSTDYPRTILYCVVTSVFIVYSLKKYNLTIYYPKTGSDISLNINKYVERSNIYSNPCFYFSIVLLYPISQFGYIRLPYDCLLYKYLSFVKYCILTTYMY